MSFALDSFPIDTFTRSVVSLRIVQNAVRKTSREIVFRSSYCSSVVGNLHNLLSKFTVPLAQHYWSKDYS